MKKAKKVLLLVLCAALLVSASVAGTMAYLTSTTKTVKNIFTVGKVDITLHEPLIDTETGKKLTGEKANITSIGIKDIKAIPGRVIEKEPTVTVKSGSEDCYVRLFMIISWSEEADQLFEPQESNGWFNFSDKWELKARLIDEDPDYVGKDVYEFWYNGTVSRNENNDTVLDPIFTTITVPDDLSAEKFASLAGSSLEFVAQAVQAEGFDDAAEAFKEVARPTGIPTLNSVE